MKKLLLLIAALALSIGLTASANAAPTHTETEINNIGIVLDVGLFGPEYNGVYQWKHDSVHYGYHYGEYCFADGRWETVNVHVLYNINVGTVHFLANDLWCPA